VPLGVVTATWVLKARRPQIDYFYADLPRVEEMPKPERMLVLPSPFGSKAKPTRGEKLR